jgi:SH3-like domain-containing protein
MILPTTAWKAGFMAGAALAAVAAAIAMTVTMTTAAFSAAELRSGSVSGLPVPRYVSLKPDKVNVRGGPTKDHDVVWQYTRAGLPVEVTAESENWRRVRDWEGSEGWVYHSLLSGRRTAIVKSRDQKQLVPLHEQPDVESGLSARLQSGVFATVKSCTGRWCRVAGKGFDGWVAQERLWGVYPNEKID